MFRIRIGSGFNQVSGSGFGIRIRIQEGKNDPQKYKKVKISCLKSAECSLLRAEGFSCSFDVLFGGLGISKSQFLIKKYQIFFQLWIFFNFWSSIPGSGSIVGLKCWIRIRNTAEHYLKASVTSMGPNYCTKNFDANWNFRARTTITDLLNLLLRTSGLGWTCRCQAILGVLSSPSRRPLRSSPQPLKGLDKKLNRDMLKTLK